QHSYNSKTDIVVAVGGMIVDVPIHGPRVVLIVDPRAAPQARRSEPSSLRCAYHYIFMAPKTKKILSACGARGCATRYSPPSESRERRGTQHHHNSKTDIEVADGGRSVEAPSHGPREDLIVEPRAAPPDAAFIRPQILFPGFKRWLFIFA